MPELEIRAAAEDDVPLILSLIKELAEYERLSHEVVVTEEVLRGSLFGELAGRGGSDLPPRERACGLRPLLS